MLRIVHSAIGVCELGCLGYLLFCVFTLPPIESGQFRSRKFVMVLKNNGLIGSMGRVASAADNAAIESFHSLLQKNVLNTRRWETKEELRLAIVT
jgi:putative transposase